MKKFLFTFFLLFFGVLFSQDYYTHETNNLVLDSVIQEKAEEQGMPTHSSIERVISFHSDIDVKKNGKIFITEKITVDAKGIDIRHGIYRSLPIEREINGEKIFIDYKILSVKKNGIQESFHTKSSDGLLKIYIGKNCDVLEPNVYEYELTYETKNQIGYFKDFDELYWNVNGNSWQFPTDSISAKITLPPNAKILKNACYTGEYKGTQNNCTVKKISNDILFWTAKNLDSNEGLSVAVGFNKGVVDALPPPSFFKKNFVFLVAFLVFLGLCYYFYNSWMKFGVDPQKPAVFPQFNIPENLSPASLGFIKKEAFSENLITASMVNLAVKGFVKIYETNEEKLFGLYDSLVFNIEKLKEPDETLAKEEIILMDSLFTKENKTIKLDSNYNDKLVNAMNAFKESLKIQHKKFLQEGNNLSKIWKPAAVILFTYIFLLLYSYFVYPDFEKLWIGFILLLILIAFFAIASFFDQLVFGFNKPVAIAITWIFIFIFKFSLNISFKNISTGNFTTAYLFIILSTAFLFMYKILIKKPTEEKLKLKSLIDGLNLYIGTAEAETLKLKNPPQFTPQHFEQLLPYAIVFKLSDVWGDKLKTHLEQSHSEKDYHSPWYSGDTYNYGNFGSSFSETFTSSVTTSSSSGSGGGGFSGGGGGGGGGGGW